MTDTNLEWLMRETTSTPYATIVEDTDNDIPDVYVPGYSWL